MTQINTNGVKNELRLNLNALVSNLNLMSICKQPKPIIIENIQNNNHAGPPRSLNSSIGSEFSFINENKLHMYSFLAKRKLEEAKRLGKFNQQQTTINAEQQAKPPDSKVNKDKNPKGNKALDLKIHSARTVMDKMKNKGDGIPSSARDVENNLAKSASRKKVVNVFSDVTTSLVSKHAELKGISEDLAESLDELVDILKRCKPASHCKQYALF
jgi:hypothetical protein